MITPGFVFSGAIKVRPYARTPYLSEAKFMPLRTISDYDPERSYIRRQSTPVLISQRQHYLLLGDMASVLLCALPLLSCIVIETPRSYINELPDTLLGPNVLIAGARGRITELLLAASRKDLCSICFNPRRRYADSGDNRVLIEAYLYQYRAEAFQAALPLCELYRACVPELED